MFGTKLCVLLKGLVLAKAVVALLPKDNTTPDSLQEECVSMCPDLNLTQNLKPNRNNSDSVTVNNEVDKVPLANMSMISVSIDRIPSEPTSSRAFVEFYNGFLNKKDNISVTFRWNQSEFTNEMVQGYTVQYCFIENLQKIQICDNESISATILESTVNNLKPNTTYYFQVRAHTKLGAGPYTELINVSTTHENPIPQLLIVSNGNVQLWDLDLQVKVESQVQEYSSIEDIAYSVAEHKIYWIESKLYTVTDRYNLMTWEMNKNNIKITKISIKNFPLNLCIDWVARNLYWTEFDESGNNNLMKLDLTMWQNGKYDKILKMKYKPTALTIQPSMGFLYWMEYQPDNQCAIMKSDLDGKNVQLFLKKFNMNFSPIPSTATFIYTTNTEEPLVYWIQKNESDKFELIVADYRLSRCNLILSFEDYNQYFHLLTVDMTNVYLSAHDTYILKKKYALLDNEENAFKYVQIVRNTNIDNMKAFGKSLQPYPRTECLTPDKNNYNITIVNITANSIVLNFPEPIPKRGCKKYNLPTTIYTIYVSHCVDNKLNKFDKFNMQTYERYYEIQNLTPLTEYKLKLALSNFYFNQLSMDPLFGSDVILITNPDKLNAPENVTV